jgi:hypothetical protein
MAEETTNQGLGLGFSVDVDTKGHDKGAKKVEKRVEKLGKKLDDAIRKQHKSELDKHKAFEKFQDDTSSRYRQELNELRQLEKARKRVRSYKIEADSLRSKGLSDKGYSDDQEFVKYEGGRKKMERKIKLNKQSSTLSSRMIKNNPDSMYTFSRGLLHLTDSIEKSAKRMSAINIAIKLLGDDASMKQIRQMEKDIKSGIGRARITAMSGIVIGGGAAYGGFQGSKGDKIDDVRDDYYAKVNEDVKALTASMGQFELAESESMKRRRDVIMEGKSMFVGAEDEIGKARLDAIKSWGGLFDEVIEEQFGIEKMKKNLKEQIKTLQNFKKNLDFILKDGGSIDMVQSMFEEGPASAGFAKDIVNASKEDRQLIYKDWDIKGEAQLELTELGIVFDKSDLIKNSADTKKLIADFTSAQQKLLNNESLPLEFRTHIASMGVSDTSTLQAYSAMSGSELSTLVGNYTGAIADVDKSINNQNGSLLPEITNANSKQAKTEANKLIKVKKFLEKNLSNEAWFFVKDWELPEMEMMASLNLDKLEVADLDLQSIYKDVMKATEADFKDGDGILSKQSQKMFANMTELGKSLDTVKHSSVDAWKPYSDSFGSSLSFILDGFDAINRGIMKVDKETNGALSQFLGWGALLGGLLMVVLAPLAVGIGTVGFAATFGALATAMGPIIAGLAMVLGVVIPVTIALVGVGLAIKEIWGNSKKLRESMKNTWNTLTETFTPIWETMGIMWKGFEDILFQLSSLFFGVKIDSWGGFWQAFGDDLAKIFDRITEYLPTLEEFFKVVGDLVLSFGKGFGDGFSHIFDDLLKSAEKGADSPIVLFFDAFIGGLERFTELMNDIIPMLEPISEMMGFFAGVTFGENVKEANEFLETIRLITKDLETLGDSFAIDLQVKWDKFMSWWDGIDEQIRKPIEDLMNWWFKDVIGGMGDSMMGGDNEEKASKAKIFKTVVKGMLNPAQYVGGDLAGKAWNLMLPEKYQNLEGVTAHANGTNSHPGGIALYGEEGRELWQTPDGRMGLSPGTATLTNMPKGTKVMPNAQTEQFMNNFNKNTVPAYAKGIGQIDLGDQRQTTPIVEVYIGNEKFDGHIVRVTERAVKKSETRYRRDRGQEA